MIVDGFIYGYTVCCGKQIWWKSQNLYIHFCHNSCHNFKDALVKSLFKCVKSVILNIHTGYKVPTFLRNRQRADLINQLNDWSCNIIWQKWYGGVRWITNRWNAQDRDTNIYNNVCTWVAKCLCAHERVILVLLSRVAQALGKKTPT